MLQWAIIFFMIAVIFAIFGFMGTEAGATAKILFFVFFLLFVVSLIGGIIRRA